MSFSKTHKKGMKIECQRKILIKWKNGKRTKMKKIYKSKLFVKILAGILAALMILSIAATCIYAIINMVK